MGDKKSQKGRGGMVSSNTSDHFMIQWADIGADFVDFGGKKSILTFFQKRTVYFCPVDCKKYSKIVSLGQKSLKIRSKKKKCIVHFVGAKFLQNIIFSKNPFKLSVFEKTQNSLFAPKIDKIVSNFCPPRYFAKI